MLSKGLSVVLALLFAAPAAAESWDRMEYFGVYGGTGFWGVDALSYGRYHDRYGVGLGVKAADLRAETWDLPRKGLPDASSHAMLIALPVEVRVVLVSKEGEAFQDYVTFESTDRRVEMHGWISPLVAFGDLTEARPALLGGTERDAVDGYAQGSAWDLGIGYDAGQAFSITGGRFEFRTREDATFRARQDGRWYLMTRYYYGRTHGDTYGASPWNLLHDLGRRMCRLLGGCGAIEG